MDVIARAVPAQKLELVRAIKQGVDIVAVTGDGVNDVPALQAADIGIAMGERGTRSAREVADIVLRLDACGWWRADRVDIRVLAIVVAGSSANRESR